MLPMHIAQTKASNTHFLQNSTALPWYSYCMRSFIFLLSLCFASLASHASAAGYALVLDPQYPQPAEPYTVTLTNAGGVASTVDWFVNGIEYEPKDDPRKITLTALKAGERTNIVARITSNSKAVTEVRTDVYPLTVNLNVSADTYTPAFYTGRALPSSGSRMNASVLVFDETGDATQSHSYRWRLNGKALQGGMALSSNSVVFSSGFEDELLLQVDVIAPSGAVVAQAMERIPVVEPELHFYEKNPLRGLSFVSIPDPFMLMAEETVVRAEPYYMDTGVSDGELHMEWELDGKRADHAAAQNEISLQKNGSSGKALVTFHVRNLAQLLQGVKDSFTVQF